jgi:hypothetical protein
MHITGRKRLMALVTMGSLLVAGRALAVFPDITNFENDADSYTPAGGGVNDPTLSGSPPDGWHDSRNDGAGVIEEVPSGFGGITTSVGGGANYGIVYPEIPEAPNVYSTYAYPGYSFDPLPNNSWSYQADVYTSSSAVGNHNGVPDFWWTNAVNNIDGSGYLTETGFTGEVLGNGNWRFTTTKGGLPYVDLAPNSWYTLEVSYDTSAAQLASTLNIYNQSKTALLYTHTLTTMFPEDNAPQSAQVGGPRYTWFTYFDDNLHELAVDNVGIAAPLSVVATGVPGDLDANGAFDEADKSTFAAVLSNLSATQNTVSMGDVNGDGVVNYFDVSAFSTLAPSGGVSASAVPEPSTFVLAVAGLVGLGLSVRRRAG